MNSFQDSDILAIQRFKADVFVLTRDRIRFRSFDNKDTSFSAIIDSNVFHGNLEILEDAVRNKKKIWIILEVRAFRRASSANYSDRSLFLSDAHYLTNEDEIEDVNPSKR